MKSSIKIACPDKYQAIYDFVVCIYLIFAILNTSLFSSSLTYVYKTILLFSIFLLMCREAMHQNIAGRKLALLIIAFLLIFFSAFGSNGRNSHSILTIIIFVFTATDINHDKTAQVCFNTISGTLLFVIICSKLGIINDYIYVMAGYPRHFLGFLYALQPAGLMLELIALNVYIHRNRKKNIMLVILLVGELWIYRETRARLTLFFSLVFAAYYVIDKYKPKLLQRRLLVFLEWTAFIWAPLLSIYLTLTYNSNKWKLILNNMFADRLKYGYQSIMTYGIHLLGKNISWSGMGLNPSGQRTLANVWSGYDWVDNAYIQAVQLYGLIITVPLLVLITFALYRLAKNKNYYLCFILLIYAMYGMIDTAILTLFYNVFWIFLAQGLSTNLLSRGKRKENKYESKKLYYNAQENYPT